MITVQVEEAAGNSAQAHYDPLEPTSAGQLRNSGWLVPAYGSWGVKKNSAAHLFPQGQHFSLCGTRAEHADSIVLENPWESDHPICRYCQRIFRPRIGPRGTGEKGSRPDIEASWRLRKQAPVAEPLLSVSQFEQLLEAKVNFGFQVTRNKIMGNTLYIFVDTGLVPSEHLEWLTRRARSREGVEWVEIIRWADSTSSLVDALVTTSSPGRREQREHDEEGSIA